jgi:hypothetical protein
MVAPLSTSRQTVQATMPCRATVGRATADRRQSGRSRPEIFIEGARCANFQPVGDADAEQPAVPDLVRVDSGKEKAVLEGEFSLRQRAGCRVDEHAGRAFERDQAASAVVMFFAGRRDGGDGRDFLLRT